MKNVMKRGFTLIELLVVIAIIGILAAVVLGSLNDARDGGRNASVQGSMNSIRNQAELLYNSANFSYAAVCADASLDNMVTSILANSPATSEVLTDTLQTATTYNCVDTATAYAASVPLNTPSGGTQQYFCVDSTGVARSSATPLPSAGTVCP